MIKKIILIIVVIIIVAVAIFFGATPTGKAIWNNWFHAVQKSDDATNYATLKNVEDTCRTMIASYNSDLLTYEQYKDNDNEEKSEWAEQAKMRANKTAATYNEFILKNSYIWQGNIPQDIKNKLDYIS